MTEGKITVVRVVPVRQQAAIALDAHMTEVKLRYGGEPPPVLLAIDGDKPINFNDVTLIGARLSANAAIAHVYLTQQLPPAFHVGNFGKARVLMSDGKMIPPLAPLYISANDDGSNWDYLIRHNRIDTPDRPLPDWVVVNHLARQREAVDGVLEVLIVLAWGFVFACHEDYDLDDAEIDYALRWKESRQ